MGSEFPVIFSSLPRPTCRMVLVPLLLVAAPVAGVDQPDAASPRSQSQTPSLSFDGQPRQLPAGVDRAAEAALQCAHSVLSRCRLASAQEVSSGLHTGGAGK